MARGQMFMCYVRNPRNIHIFVRAPAGRIGDRGDRDTIAAYKKYFSKKIALAQLILQNLQNNLFTKQIPSHVLLQTGTNQWQQHCNKNVLVEIFCNNYKDYYKSNCSKKLFCNNFGQDGIVYLLDVYVPFLAPSFSQVFNFIFQFFSDFWAPG